MRKSFVGAVCAAISMVIAISSCQKEITQEQMSSEKVKLQISVPTAQTKVLSSVNESAVNDYQVFLFNDNGVLEDYVHQDTPDITLECTMGSKTVAVLVNAPVMSNITTMTALQNTVSKLSDNTFESFVMEGQVPVEVNSTDEISVEVPVSRKVAKIELQYLSVMFDMPQYNALPFKVSAVYLINAPGDMTYFSSAAPTLWLNKLGYVAEDDNTFLYDDMNDVEVSLKSPYSTHNVFYCYPNDSTEDSFSTIWSPRCTRLVVEAMIGDMKYYYPVTLPKLESNKKYNVSLIITRPGAESADVVVDKKEGNFSVVVQDWDDGGLVYKEI